MTNDDLPAILDTLSAAVFLIDANRQILLANRAASELFGHGLAGNDFVRAVRHPDCLNCINDVLGGREESRVVISLPHPINTIYQVKVVGLEAADRGEPRAVISIDDVSHIHEAEQMRSDFVANVSHELRSPLTALSGFIETLKVSAKEDPDARERFLNVMEREANRMNRLIDDLLSLSKVEVNARIRPTGSSDVRSIIERVIATLSLQAADDGKNIQFDNSTSVDLIPGDDDELTQVFQNLIENAVKYGGPDLNVTVTIERIADAVGMRGPALSIEIRDSGPGIPPEHIPRLTERFYRVDDSRSRDKGGTGLGLAIVKHIVARHRGRLQIRSEIGVGSTFSVLLPITGGVP